MEAEPGPKVSAIANIKHKAKTRFDFWWVKKRIEAYS